MSYVKAALLAYLKIVPIPIPCVGLHIQGESAQMIRESEDVLCAVTAECASGAEIVTLCEAVSESRIQ